MFRARQRTILSISAPQVREYPSSRKREHTHGIKWTSTGAIRHSAIVGGMIMDRYVSMKRKLDFLVIWYVASISFAVELRDAHFETISIRVHCLFTQDYTIIIKLNTGGSHWLTGAIVVSAAERQNNQFIQDNWKISQKLNSYYFVIKEIKANKMR